MSASSFDLSALDGNNGFVLSSNDLAGIESPSVSSAGDINDDGFDDILIANGGIGDNYLIFGQAFGFDAELDLSTLDGRNGFAVAGHSSLGPLSSAGDINGDGFDDILIGGFGRGSSSVIFGQSSGFGAFFDLSTLDGNNGFVLNGIDADNFQHGSISPAGDINGDGFGDILIGVPGADPENVSLAGESYVVFGQVSGFGTSLDLSALDGSNGFVLNGIDASDFSGSSISSVGDINGDGIDDILIGAPDADPDGVSRAGESYIVFGQMSGFGASFDLSTLDGTNGFVLNGIDTNDRSGGSVSAAGDINGDGVDDILIGANVYSPSRGVIGGDSYVIFGQTSGFVASFDLSTLDGNNGFVLNGIDVDDGGGSAVSSAGDINGDGFDDILIGAPGGNSGAGESYVVFGQASGFAASFDLSTLDGSNGFVVSGIESGDGSGSRVSSAGDINNDGFDDILIGTFRTDIDGNIGVAESYVIFGAPSEAITHAGSDIAETVRGGALGDTLDGQGNDDILIGAAGNDRLIGGVGNDSLFGGEGADTLNGGQGDDFILGGGTSADLRDLVFAGDGNDSIDAGYGNDLVFGQDGDDNIVGGFGSDTLNGQNGNDIITGSALSDVVSGNAGDDFVNGGFGHDHINGGTGADRFFHLGILDHGSDWVQDYNAGEGDVLHFGNRTATVSDFQINYAHTATDAGERSGDDDVAEAFVIYRPTGQIMWALVDGQGQDEINLWIGSDAFDLLA